MSDVRIASITVGKRRREAMGDITELARSIKKYGLPHPIVIDDQKNLVAGGRRLAACEQLGWDTIPVTKLSELSEKQRREIELEENLQRKDLTAYEQARTITQLQKAAREAIEEEAALLPKTGKKQGRPTKGFDGDEWLVASCATDNWKKGTYRYCPPSHAHLIDQLPGTKPWTVWRGA